MDQLGIFKPLRLHLLPVTVATIVAATASPAELRGPIWWNGDINFHDVAQNLLLYVPFGAALWKGHSWVVLAIAALLSSSIEVAQVWMINRYPSPIDVAANAAGAVIGAVAWRRAGLGSTLGAWTPYFSAKGFAVLALAGAMILVTWGLPVRSAALSNWEPRFPLQLGNEATQDRPWRGEIHQLVLRPSARSADRPPVFIDSASFLELAGPIVFRGDAGMLVPEAASLAFARAAMQQNSFTAIARVTPTDTIQDGPARIVSFSAGPYYRNFDLGQQGRSIVFRVRTPVSGLNGESFRAETAPVLHAGEEVLIAASYDGAIARVHINDQLQGRENIAAAGCSIPIMCDSAVSIAWAVLGAVTTLIALALLPWSAREHALGIATIAAVGALAAPRLLQVGSVPLATQPWAQMMALVGAVAVAVAAAPPRNSMSRSSSE